MGPEQVLIFKWVSRMYISVTSGSQVRIILIIYICSSVSHWHIESRKGRKYTYLLNRLDRLSSENVQLYGRGRYKCLIAKAVEWQYWSCRNYSH
jgi:hypothetical protein